MDIKEIYTRLSDIKDLKPSDEVNLLFTTLVDKVIQNKDVSFHKILTSYEIKHLQQMCSKGEYELEKFWANTILSSSNPLETIKKFPYFHNYLDLSRLEYMTLKGCSDHNEESFIFIGGGPLPLTAIALVMQFKVNVTVLEIDKNAYDVSKKVINSLNLGEKINIINKDGAEFREFYNYSVIIVAALAGMDGKAKKSILNQIKKTSRPGTHIIARSSWGSRKLLYKPLSKSIYSSFKPILELHPHHEVVNSVIILKNI